MRISLAPPNAALSIPPGGATHPWSKGHTIPRVTETIEVNERTDAPPGTSPVDDRKTTTITLFVAVILATILFTVPALIQPYLPEPDVTQQPVETGGIAVPAASGGDLACDSVIQLTDTIDHWTCGETSVGARTQETTDDPARALTRFVRGQMLIGDLAADAATELRDGAYQLRTEDEGEPVVAVSIPRESDTAYFLFAYDEADRLSQPLIDAVQAGRVSGDHAQEEDDDN